MIQPALSIRFEAKKVFEHQTNRQDSKANEGMNYDYIFKDIVKYAYTVNM